MPGKVKEANRFLLGQLGTESGNRLLHRLARRIRLQLDGKAGLPEFESNRIGIVDRVLQRRIGIRTVADHQRQTRQCMDGCLRQRVGRQPW